MAHRNPLLVDVIAQELLQELQGYDRLLAEVRAADWPTPLVLALADQGDRVLRCAHTLPRLDSPVAGFLVTRTQLSRRLVGSRHGRREALAQLHGEHLETVTALRGACQRLRDDTRSPALHGPG
jgi:hypothetical protein